MSESNGPGEDITGATPIAPNEADRLRPSHIQTQGELNAWEQLNIGRAFAWAMSRRKRTASSVLTVAFAEQLHRRMFDQTWEWAGVYRRTERNIGLPARQVRVALRERLADAQLWLAEEVYDLDEIAARLHFQLVVVHPWPNGNGRWSRLMADTLLHASGHAAFTWGRGLSNNADVARAKYLAAVRAADSGNFALLLQFVRS